MTEPTREDRAVLAAIFAKMDVTAMAVATSVIFALGLFLATALLLVQSVPEGYPIGPHLSALADYLPGYSVTWGGAFIGAGYGALIGAVVGFFIALTWNITHYLSLGAMLLKAAVMAD